jgi:hypothetical protein
MKTLKEVRIYPHPRGDSYPDTNDAHPPNDNL